HLLLPSFPTRRSSDLTGVDSIFNLADRCEVAVQLFLLVLTQFITQAINRSVVEIHDRFAGGSSAAATTAATAPCKEHIQSGLWAGDGWAPVVALTAQGGFRSGTNVQILHGVVERWYHCGIRLEP